MQKIDLVISTATPLKFCFIKSPIKCAVSNYFHALFLGCWRNTDKNVIVLPGITDEMLDILLGQLKNSFFEI